jgi:hypothetical protein
VRATDCEVAWAAGLFEGEGSITQSSGTLYVRLKMTHEGVVVRFDEVVRYGKVYGPYNHQYNDGSIRKPYWVWLAREYDALLALAPIEAVLLDSSPSVEM